MRTASWDATAADAPQNRRDQTDAIVIGDGPGDGKAAEEEKEEEKKEEEKNRKRSNEEERALNERYARRRRCSEASVSDGGEKTPPSSCPVSVR